LALIICGVFQKGCEPSCISTTLPRLPTSAPGPPPRVRWVSGLSQAARAVKAINTASIRFISHSLSREDDDQAENKAADQHQRCRSRGRRDYEEQSEQGSVGPDRTVGDREQDASVTGNIESENTADRRNEPA